jgi:hypothetical protein
MPRKTRKNRSKKSSSPFTRRHYMSGDGMLTTVWGPAVWHLLHIISFNYPVKPTSAEKRNYCNFFKQLQYILPCKYCRINLRNNLKKLPLTPHHLKNRNNFSRYVYKLHELVNNMLGKKSGLTYNQVRDRYENFRSRCTQTEIAQKILTDVPTSMRANSVKNVNSSTTTTTNRNITVKRRGNGKGRGKEKGCTEPLYGHKSKCVIKIVPKITKCNTFQMDKKCAKTKAS